MFTTSTRAPLPEHEPDARGRKQVHLAAVSARNQEKSLLHLFARAYCSPRTPLLPIPPGLCPPKVRSALQTNRLCQEMGLCATLEKQWPRQVNMPHTRTPHPSTHWHPHPPRVTVSRQSWAPPAQPTPTTWALSTSAPLLGYKWWMCRVQSCKEQARRRHWAALNRHRSRQPTIRPPHRPRLRQRTSCDWSWDELMILSARGKW
eukprot:3874941-Rhodomonas_salina.2